MSEGIQNTCFFLMPFKKPFTDYYEVLKPTFENIGLRVLKADEVPGVGIILEEIWSSILSARIIIADLSGANNNVLYEVGLSHAMDKPVIILSQNIEDIPSDIRHLRVIIYDTDDPKWKQNLGKEVVTSIQKILHKGSYDIIPPAFSKQFEMSYELYEITDKFDLDTRRYQVTWHKMLLNRSEIPITQIKTYYIFNRYPKNPVKDFNFYKKNEVIWKDLQTKAWDREGKLDTKLIHDYNNSKEYLIIFAQKGVDRSIAPQECREYWHYAEIPFSKLYPWMYIKTRYPTFKTRINVIIPKDLNIQVGGRILSDIRDPIPVSQKIKRISEGDNIRYVWESDQITIGNAYQLIWSELPKKYMD